MKVHRKFKPYVRLANGKEGAKSIALCFRLAHFCIQKKPFYVMVQRGFPNLVMDAASSKEELKKSPFVVRLKIRTFREWANKVQKIATSQAS